MLSALLTFARWLKLRSPRLFGAAASLAGRTAGVRLGMFPRILAREEQAVSRVLRSSRWNMAYGRALEHDALEKEFAQYVGAAEAVAVNTGGMALQMALRALGLGPGDQVIHQVDTCAATALAVMNAGCTPMFADISQDTFMLDPAAVSRTIGARSRALIATHMWGNPESLAEVGRLATERGIPLIEDACLSLGTTYAGRSVGTIGKVGFFSFGCLKPIQAGEGGMLVTDDASLARELRSLRHWGDRTIEYGVRDTQQLAWNGRMSEIIAAVVREQLRGYPRHLSQLRAAARSFSTFLRQFDGLKMMIGAAHDIEEVAFTQVVLRVDEEALGRTKSSMMESLQRRGVQLWHANFEPIPTLSFFSGGEWRRWIRDDVDMVARNYSAPFPRAEAVYGSGGIGIAKTNMLSPDRLAHLKRQIEAFARGRTSG